jgi:AcrR family transcriptional regulator
MPTPTWENLDPAKRRRVLDAAMREFGTHGFSAGSLNVVARDAGVAKGSLFQYFTDKLELFGFVCEVVSTEIRDDLVGRMGPALGEDPEFFDIMEWLLREWFTYYATHELQRGVTAATNLEIDPEVRTAVRDVVNRHYHEVLRPLMERATARGDFVPGADLDTLAGYLLLLFPHCAIAPWVPAVDPVHGLYGLALPELHHLVPRILGPLRAAFSARTSAPVST